MDDLLIVAPDGAGELSIDAHGWLVDLERQAKEIKAKQDALRARILEEMEAKGFKKIETEDISIVYKAGYDKETFQSKEFRADHPDLYDEYIKMSPVKASIVIKLKEEKHEEV